VIASGRGGVPFKQDHVALLERLLLELGGLQLLDLLLFLSHLLQTPLELRDLVSVDLDQRLVVQDLRHAPHHK
jgi:hypothetical protein